jgi:hypothetical protein
MNTYKYLEEEFQTGIYPLSDFSVKTPDLLIPNWNPGPRKT